jgi:toxin ParE1/3/4
VKLKPVVPRKLAESDIETAFNFYLAEGGADVAIAFVDSLEEAVLRVSRHPSAGSPRYAHELDLPGLRSWPLKNFPYLIFYLEQSTHIDVWRVLHSHTDIPEWMSGPDR